MLRSIVRCAALAAVLALPAQAPPDLYVAGRVLTSGGPLPERAEVHTMWQTGSGGSGSAVRIAPDGSFYMPVPHPGRYAIQVQPGQTPWPDGEYETGYAAVTVGSRPVPSLIVRTTRGAYVRGRVRTAPAAPARSWPKVVLHAQLAIDDAYPANAVSDWEADGRFVFRQLTGPRVFRAGWSNGDDGTAWWFDSVLLDGADITDQPVRFEDRAPATLEIVFTQNPTRVRGAVTDSAGQPARGAFVLLFPEDTTRWRQWSLGVRVSRTDAAGRFSTAAMPAGRYLAAAFARGAFSSDHEVKGDLAAHAPGATPFTLRRDAPADLTLTIQPKR